MQTYFTSAQLLIAFKFELDGYYQAVDRQIGLGEENSRRRTNLWKTSCDYDPPFLVRLTDAWIERVGRIEFFIEFFQGLLGFVHVADVVFGGILRPLGVEPFQHFGLHGVKVRALLKDVVVMKHMSHEVTV